MGTEEEYHRLTHIVEKLNIEPGAKVLDIGSGTGLLLPLLKREVGANGKVIALDYAKEMVVRARAKGSGDNIDHIIADAMYIPLSQRSINYAICNAVFPHFSDMIMALTEIARVLRSGGLLLICHAKSRQFVNELHRTIGGAISEHIIPDDSEVRRLLQSSGFRDIDIEDGIDRYVASAIRI